MSTQAVSPVLSFHAPFPSFSCQVADRLTRAVFPDRSRMFRRNVNKSRSGRRSKSPTLRAAICHRVPHRAERRRVGQVGVDELLDGQPGVERDGDDVDALGRALLADDLAAEQPAASSARRAASPTIGSAPGK